jgi:hypothetical protein
MADKLTLVLTVALSDTGRPGNDLDRASILLESLNTYVRAENIEELLVITRPQDIENLSTYMSKHLRSIRYAVVDENSICPVLRTNPSTYNQWPTPNQGWLRQQMLKLGASKYVTSEFYMVLDADVIFFRALDTDFLLQERRSLLNIENEADYRRIYVSSAAKHEAEVRKVRYRNAAALLGIGEYQRTKDYWYGETPVIFSRSIAQSLLSYIQNVHGHEWDIVLSSRSNWTEYPLYFLYAEENQLFDTYHRIGDCNSLLNLESSIWWLPERYRDNRTLSSWDVSNLASDKGPGYAIVVQSYLGYCPKLVRRKLQSSGLLP